jgi:TetR/AcrR family transcriptional regulator
MAPPKSDRKPASAKTKTKPGPRGNPEVTRAAILEAALSEFATEGLAGARTDHIARAAGVNKALLYYYFEDKETLYGAALDHVFGSLAAAINEVLEREMPPREKVLAAAAAHFDFVAHSPIYPRLVQREMMRAGRAGSPHIRRLVDSFMRPMMGRWLSVLETGIRSGEFREVDPQNFILSMVAMNVFYFSSAPVVAEIMRTDPLAPEIVARGRRAVLDLLAAALFCEPGSSVLAPNPTNARGKQR